MVYVKMYELQCLVHKKLRGWLIVPACSQFTQILNVNTILLAMSFPVTFTFSETFQIYRGEKCRWGVFGVVAKILWVQKCVTLYNWDDLESPWRYVIDEIMRMIPEKFNWRRKSQPKCAYYHHLYRSPGLEQTKKAEHLHSSLTLLPNFGNSMSSHYNLLSVYLVCHDDCILQQGVKSTLPGPLPLWW